MTLDELDTRLRTILPEEYQSTYESIQPVSMGSAALRYATDGRVAWDLMWDSYCDLAMAGGPPHKGTLLAPGSAAEVAAQPGRYQEVTDEICRGITLVTDLQAVVSSVPGWVRVRCYSEEMAGWLLRAIVMENVAVRRERDAIELPAAPTFRLEKEIKNVITVIAKTSHYWLDHMPASQKRAIADLFAALAEASPLIEPGWPDDGIATEDVARAASALADHIHRDTGLRPSDFSYPGWLGVECSSTGAAVWTMRALVATNVLARREGTVLFVPVNPTSDPDGLRVSGTLAGIHRLATARQVQ